MISSGVLVSPADKNRLEFAKNLNRPGAGHSEQLLGMLNDPSWIVRRAVIDALAAQGNQATPHLTEILRSERDDETRIAAAVDALVLSKGSPEGELMELALSENTAVVADALQVLGRRRSESVVPLLVRLTKHDNDIVAVSAIEALGRIGGFNAVEALIATVKSGNFFRTFPAIDILGRSGDRRVVEPLTALLSNPNYLPEAARALGRSGEKSAVRPLASLLKSPIESVVRIAAVSLWDLRERFEDRSGGEVETIDRLLQKEVDSETIRGLARIMPGLDSGESVAICKLLGTTLNPEAAQILAGKLHGPAQVVESAVTALKRIGNESDELLERAIQKGDSLSRKILLPFMTKSNSLAEITACLADEDPEVRALACETAARLGCVQLVPQLFGLLEERNLRVVHAATAGLQALGTRETRQLACRSAASEIAQVRRAALRILSYFGDSECLEPLLKGITDSDSRVREVAIQGLPFLDDPRAYAALCESAKSSDPKTRATAMRALAQVPKSEARTYGILLNGLKDPDPWVRYYACQSLGRLTYSPASLEIAALLHDEAGQVRVSAVEALSHLESREAHRALQHAARSEEPDVKRAALVGLGIMHRAEDIMTVIEAVNSNDATTRLIALSAAVNFSSPLVLGCLSSAASDNDEQIRSSAINFLAARSELDATEILIGLLDSPATAEKAKVALAVPQVSRAAGLLIALESANDNLAPILVSILLRSSRSDSKKALLAAMKLNNVAARKAAAAGMAVSPNEDRLEALREAAENDPDREVRAICKLLLAEHGVNVDA